MYKEIEKLSTNIRKNILRMAHISNSSHIASCLSVVEILAVLYTKVLKINSDNINCQIRDKFILSKGHAAMALYSTMAEMGFIPKNYLERYYVNGGILPGHLDKTVLDCIDCSAGSLGHGLAIGIGMALADKNHRIFVLLGDGECNEGSVWESIMILGYLKLNNICVIIDKNNLQGYGYTKNIIDQSNLAERIRSFGLNVFEVNGHNIEELDKILNCKSDISKVIVANTIKGKGISFMENELKWHYKSPNDEEFAKAMSELENA